MANPLRRFALKLALVMGRPDVDALLDELSSTQLLEWLAYFEIDPFGNVRSDLQMAMQMALLANLHRDPKKRTRPYQPGDFIPQFGADVKQQTRQQQLEIVRMLNTLLGGTETHG